MDLNKVLVGYTRDGNEHLLYKKYENITDLFTYIRYLDLESGEYYREYDFEDKNLLSFLDVFPSSKRRMTRRKVKSIYLADRNMLLDVKGAFYGNIIHKKIIDNTFIKNMETKQNVLFARINDPEGRSMEVKTRCLYPRSENVLKGNCVRETRPIRTDLFDDVVAPKRKLLELDYRKEL